MSHKLAVFASGRGSNLQSIIDQGFNIGVIISDKKQAKALEKAKEKKIPSLFIDPKAFSSKTEYEKELLKVVNEHNCNLICLAGFMRILSPYFIRNAQMKILNIHPSLLPSFPGLHAHQQALDYGVKFSGCTVHFVDEGMDSGPIIMQAVVPVSDEDTEETLVNKILKEEHRIYPEAIRLVVEEKIKVQNRKVIINE
ncbi:formyltetrahydrofolate-dependent phosphoribosylglycinamide formyltransferase [Desulfonispora thiosulfatigenes DSM 11270]|uniref:Phosphoribosylglycinamide formyltransferase n=1 Tax=Desulfonispora thiosulfatigenes DSM 11270 TaxID=656914 RepID=A0A1W1VE96_DESTI|nr:phosphoribosylglycinamide formyltransferase [Desulfonispora thiosulfatigenes]SMB91636.1 formyltetrahydrofolate-dependent phosphoribosylglycinamide formyltransferase [Desulfonispora thiosulfatigenes DSM 11270]